LGARPLHGSGGSQGAFILNKGKGAMQIESLELRITDHALERYCQRVEPITRQELTAIVLQQLRQGWRRQHGYMQIAGIWWRSSKQGNVLTLHTCYGRNHIDLPAAIKWAKRHGDRIALGDAYAK
jgi:hypothetical protein